MAGLDCMRGRTSYLQGPLRLVTVAASGHVGRIPGVSLLCYLGMDLKAVAFDIWIPLAFQDKEDGLGN